jgi:predicted AAA+ superfamily ATPase
MVSRVAEKQLHSLARQFRSVAVVGPRQSGKTTLVKAVFPSKPYVSLEDPDQRLIADQDSRSFLNQFPKGAIIDEAQRVPKLFSYLQQVLDTTRKDGLFILTGSNNFLLQESISQTLAGRIGYMDLFPFCYSEVVSASRKSYSTNELIWRGCYPELYDRNRKPEVWYPAYIRTYIERDVKQLRNVTSTMTFNRFLKLCAGRIGQQLNITALSNESGIDVKTVQKWLSILQSSFIIFLLSPHHRNFNKRLTKTQKLYFCDTGLACSLLDIKDAKELAVSHFRGPLFENYVVSECLKQKNNSGFAASFYYWRDNKGVEIDLLVDAGRKLTPIELKSAQTFNEDFTKNLRLWNEYAHQRGGHILFDGKDNFTRSDKINVRNWRTFDIREI